MGWHIIIINQKVLMNINQSYPSIPFTGETHLFNSTGPSGIFPMAINFTELRPNLYNLGFGLYTGGTIDDKFRTNNSDQDTILNTVGNRAKLFLDQYSGSVLYFEGSDILRTKLYERKIKRFYIEISEFFNIYGYSGASKEFYPFYTGDTYDAFIIANKTT